MSLRRTFILAFAAVAAVVAALVGVASYVATAHNLTSQVDESLAEAADTLAAGGALGLPPSGPGPDGMRLAPPTREERGRGPNGHGDGPGGPRVVVQAAQRLTPDGTSIQVAGPALPVDVTDRALAADARAGQQRIQDVPVGPDTYRVLTRSTGSGAVMVGRDVDELDLLTSQLAIQIGGIGLAVLGAAALAGWLLARRITRRLLRLTEAAEEVSATGRLDVVMPDPAVTRWAA